MYNFSRRVLGILLVLVLFVTVANALPQNESIITGQFDGKQIKLEFGDWAGASCVSLMYDGFEYVDSRDHGRYLQAAANFYWADDPSLVNLTGGKIHEFNIEGGAEKFNPTEGGYAYDPWEGWGSSIVLGRSNWGDGFASSTNMAFFLQPTLNDNIDSASSFPSSGYILHKNVQIGWGGISNCISYATNFQLPNSPENLHWNYAQFEFLSLYLKIKMQKFWKVNVGSSTLSEITNVGDSQGVPVIAEDIYGSGKAIGLYSINLPQYIGSVAIGYDVTNLHTVTDCAKIALVWRDENLLTNNTTNHAFQSFIVVGTKEQCKTALIQVYNMFN